MRWRTALRPTSSATPPPSGRGAYPPTRSSTWVGWWLLGTSPQVGYWVYLVAYYYAYINLVLMFFNLIPLPPLDGSSIIAVFLPRRAMNGYYQVQRYAMVILLALIIVIPWVTGVDGIGLYLNVTAGNLIDLPLPAHVLFGR